MPSDFRRGKRRNSDRLCLVDQSPISGRIGTCYSISGNNIPDTVKVICHTGPYEGYVAEALRLAFPANINAESRFVMNFTLYLDESGTHRGSQNVILAGYAATTEQWAGFELEWQKAIQCFHLPFFHMADFANRAPAYSTWTDEVREVRITSLIEIINTYITCSFGLVLPMPDYVAALAKVSETIQPYGFAASYLTFQVPFVLRQLHSDPWIAYVLDHGAPRGNEIIKAIRTVAKDRQIAEERRLLSICSGDKQRFVPLQAADILAYELYRFAPYLGNTSPSKPPTMNYINMLSSKPNIWVRLDESRIRSLTVVSKKVVEDILAKKARKGNTPQ